jgi:hypothetical protein
MLSICGGGGMLFCAAAVLMDRAMTDTGLDLPKAEVGREVACCDEPLRRLGRDSKVLLLPPGLKC